MKEISDLAVVRSPIIGKNTRIMEYVVIDEEVKIGAGCILHPNVVIQGSVTIGDEVEIYPSAYLGKKPNKTKSIVRELSTGIEIRIGDRCAIGCHAIVYHGVTIGNDVLIGDGASIRENCVIDDECIIGRYVTLQFDVNVGKGSRVIDHSTLAGRTYIGRGCFISLGVLTTGDRDFGRRGYKNELQGGPKIEDFVSIGANATINSGVRIGKRAIIGAGAVVTRDVESGTTVMGIPARPTGRSSSNRSESGKR